MAGPAEVKGSELKLLIMKSKPTGKADQALAGQMDELICSSGSSVPGFKILCESTLAMTKNFRDLMFKNGSGDCEEGFCVDVLVLEYKPHNVIRTDISRTGRELSLTMKMMDSTGKTVQRQSTSRFLMDDPDLVTKIMTVMPNLFKSGNKITDDE